MKKGLKKLGNGAKTAAGIGVAVIIIGASLTIGQYFGNFIKLPFHFHLHSNKLPGQYINDRANFTDSLQYLSQSTEIINAHGDVNQVTSLLSKSIASSNKVSDAFLNYLNPQLKDEYRNKLILGEQLDLEGLEESDPTTSVQNQTKGLQLDGAWVNWWNANKAALSNKAFGN